MIKILLVEDHLLFADSLKNALLALYQVTIVSTFKALREVLQTTQFDIGLLDMQLCDGSDGLELMAAMNTAKLRTIIISSTVDTEKLQTCFLWGLAGYFDKNVPLQILQKAIADVLQNKQILDAEFFDMIGGVAESDKIRLTGREELIANLLLQDPMLSNKEIGKIQNLSESRVKACMTALLEKYEVLHRRDLVREIRRRGFICQPGRRMLR